MCFFVDIKQREQLDGKTMKNSVKCLKWLFMEHFSASNFSGRLRSLSLLSLLCTYLNLRWDLNENFILNAPRFLLGGSHGPLLVGVMPLTRLRGEKVLSSDNASQHG